MKKPQTNFAFIDCQNLHMAVRELNWRLDWGRFRRYLSDKYQVKTAYGFIGYMPENQDLYRSLQEAGFILVFKEILKLKDGTVKGNVDAELVLNAMAEYNDYDGAVIVTGDGDFACLVRYLSQKDKLEIVLAPNEKRYSALLKKAAGSRLAFVSRLKQKLQHVPRPKTPKAAKESQQPKKDTKKDS